MPHIDGKYRESTRRAIFVNRYYFPDESATSQMLTGVARGLVTRCWGAHDIDVCVVTSRQLYEAPNALLAAHDNIDGVRVYRVWTSRFGRRFLAGRALDYASFYMTAAFRLFWLARRGDVVIAKTDPPMLSILAAIVTRLRGAKLINWLQDIFPEVATQLGANPFPRRLNELLLKLRDHSLRAAQCNVVLGERMRDHLLSRNVALQQICIVENWADGELIAPRDSNATQLRTANNLHGRFVVAYSGNLGRAHEYESILHAAQILRSNSEIVFLMIGGGANMQQLRGAVESCELSNFVFLPYQRRKALADSLAAADVHLISLLPGLEGLIVPSKFYGILAAGRPAIFIGDLDGELARRIGESACGEVVVTGDGAGLADKIMELKLQPDRARTQGQRARMIFEQQYTLQRAISKWRQVIEPQ
jgi:colanic acid biosynthesis glycosyl transferase WcaI